MRGVVRVRAAAIARAGVDAIENGRVEIRQAEPERAALVRDAVAQAQLARQQSPPSGGVQHPAGRVRVFRPVAVPHRDPVPRARAQLDPHHLAVDVLNAVVVIELPQRVVQGEPVDEKRRQRRIGGDAVHDVARIRGSRGVQLVVEREAVLGKLLLDEMPPKTDFLEQLRAELDQRFAHDGQGPRRRSYDVDVQGGHVAGEPGSREVARDAVPHDQHVTIRSCPSHTTLLDNQEGSSTLAGPWRASAWQPLFAPGMVDKKSTPTSLRFCIRKWRQLVAIRSKYLANFGQSQVCAAPSASQGRVAMAATPCPAAACGTRRGVR